MKSFIIHLEPNQFNGNYVYYPNHNLKGIVAISLDNETKLRACYVVIHGIASCNWIETKVRSTGTGADKKKSSQLVHYEGREVYLNSKTYLFGYEGADDQKLQPGVHRFNFECLLPEALPYSMGAKHGEIAYYVEAVLDIPWATDKTCTFPFGIARNDDLNLYPELRLGQNIEKSESFCCLFCKSGPLTLTVSIPYSGFAVGQKLLVKIEYSNQSNVNVRQTKVRLNRITTYTADKPQHRFKKDQEKMVEKSIDGVLKKSSIELECNLDIPIILLNSNKHYCDIIRIEYQLEVEGYIRGFHSNLKITLPLTIGSISLNDENEDFTSVPTAPIEFKNGEASISSLGWNVSAADKS